MPGRARANSTRNLKTSLAKRAALHPEETCAETSRFFAGSGGPWRDEGLSLRVSEARIRVPGWHHWTVHWLSQTSQWHIPTHSHTGPCSSGLYILRAMGREWSPWTTPVPSDRLRRNRHGDWGRQGSWTQQWRQTEVGGPQEGKARVEGTGGRKPGWGGRQEACDSKWHQKKSLQRSVVPSTERKHTQAQQGPRRSRDGRREGKARLIMVYGGGGEGTWIAVSTSLMMLEAKCPKVGVGYEGKRLDSINSHSIQTLKETESKWPGTCMQDLIWNFSSTQLFYRPQKYIYRWSKVLWMCILSG